MGDLEERSKSIVERFTEAVNNRRLDLLDELVAPDFVRHCQATPLVEVRSLEGFKRYLEADWASLPDSRIVSRFMVAEGDLVGAYATYTGTQSGQMGPFPPSGKRLELDVSGMFRIADGKIAEMWMTWDNLAALAQLGHFPPPPDEAPE